MPLLVFRATRRPSASREALAGATLELCRKIKLVDQSHGRFYWTSTDTLAVIVEAESYSALNRVQAQTDDRPVPELEAARFALADVADITPGEIWRDPRHGQLAYEAAGRGPDESPGDEPE